MNTEKRELFLFFFFVIGLLTNTSQVNELVNHVKPKRCALRRCNRSKYYPKDFICPAPYTFWYRPWGRLLKR